MRAILSLLLLSSAVTTLAQEPPATGDQSYTLKTQSNVVLIPTTVQTKHGEMIYELKPEQFVVEDNGVPQTVHLDEDTDALGLSLVVVVQCSRAAGFEYTKLAGLGTMVDAVAGDAPREVAIVTYGSAPLLLGKFSNNVDAMSAAPRPARALRRSRRLNARRRRLRNKTAGSPPKSLPPRHPAHQRNP